jgi:hypothetical protein
MTKDLSEASSTVFRVVRLLRCLAEADEISLKHLTARLNLCLPKITSEHNDGGGRRGLNMPR